MFQSNYNQIFDLLTHLQQGSNYTPRNELQRVLCFWPVLLSVSQSVLFFLSAQLLWNLSTEFMKLCSYEGHNVKMRISTGNFDSFFFLDVIIPHATTCWSTYYVFDPSVSQSVSPVFLVSATPLKSLNRIS